MELLKITISPEPRTSKPIAAYERGILSNTPPVDADFESILHVIGEGGHSFFAGSYKLNDGDEYINTESVDVMAIIVVDIDNKDTGQPLRPHAALDRLSECGLDCSGIYRTFSDETHPSLGIDDKLRQTRRYRMLFVLEDTVVGAVNYNYLLQMIYEIFPEADRRGADSIYFGGNDVIYCNPEYKLSAYDLLAAAHAQRASKCKTPQSRRRNYQKSLDSAPNGIFNKGSKTVSGIYSTIRNAVIEPQRISGWEGQLRRESELVDGFLNCERKYWHDELLGLYLTFRMFVCGIKLWKESINNNYAIDNIKIDTIHGYIGKYEARGGQYHEMSLAKFAPNDSATKKHWKLSQIINKRGQTAKKIKGFDPHFISLKDSRFHVEYLFKHALSKWDMPVTVLKIATGVGKTFQIEICEYLDECILACQTHHLVAKLSENLIKNGIEHNVVPPLPELPPEISREYHSLLQIGAHDDAAGFLQSLIDSNLSIYFLDGAEAGKLRLNLICYFEALNRAIDDTIPVICTHKRIMHTGFKNHSIAIVDEDIINSIGEVKSVSAKSLRLAIKALDDSDRPKVTEFLGKLIDMTKSPEAASKILVPTISLFSGDEFLQTRHIRQLLRNGVEGELISLLRSEYICIHPTDWNDPEGEKSISFILRHQLPVGMRFIILSATAGESMYNSLFEEVDFYDVSSVQLRGAIRQFSTRSFSRNSFRNETTKELARQIGSFAGNRPAITYKGKKFQKFYDNPFRHLEDVMGTNELSGQNPVVVGLTNKPPYFYLLWASILGIEFNEMDSEIDYRTLVRNGHEFKMMTFASPELQDIQCHFIESSLVQAVGRARPLEHDVTIDVFTTYPVPNAIHYHLDQMDLIGAITKVFGLVKKTVDAPQMTVSLYDSSGSLAS
ncbi:MAG: hypothetical protein DRI69_06940 [Bacteroidetes bacterium]|nr:MAG: hypothetical protein DRI69_06940 [Bacteroidota bacterium]